MGNEQSPINADSFNAGWDACEMLWHGRVMHAEERAAHRLAFAPRQWDREAQPACGQCGRPSPNGHICEDCSPFDPAAFGALVAQRLEATRQSYREAAPAVGVSSATLNRVARGKMPDVPTYLAVRRWLALSPTVSQTGEG